MGDDRSTADYIKQVHERLTAFYNHALQLKQALEAATDGNTKKRLGGFLIHFYTEYVQGFFQNEVAQRAAAEGIYIKVVDTDVENGNIIAPNIQFLKRSDDNKCNIYKGIYQNKFFNLSRKTRHVEDDQPSAGTSSDLQSSSRDSNNWPPEPFNSQPDTL